MEFKGFETVRNACVIRVRVTWMENGANALRKEQLAKENMFPEQIGGARG